MRKSIMSHAFSQIPNVNIPRSKFDRSHRYLTTLDAGYLVPVLYDFVYPGDDISCTAELFARLNTPLTPIMDNCYLDYFYFAVPVRLVWDNFKKFCGEQVDPGDSIDYTIPQMTGPVGGYTLGSLSDYLGIPTGIASFVHNSWYHRAYNLIFNEWFRDENLIDSVTVDKDDGPDTNTDYVLLKRCKRHDYFTSCLPWPQKSDDSVVLPLGTDAPVTGIGKASQTFSASSGTEYETGGSASVSYASYSPIDNTLGNNVFHVEEDPSNSGYPNIRADLTNATAATINELREAFQIQKLLERDARGGTRYIEIIRSHFQVVSPDQRQQRPEILGVGSVPVNIRPVVQTSESGGTPQGTLTGFGVASGSGGFSKSFTEHCLILGIVSIRADLTYSQGCDRLFSDQTRYDLYWPSFAHLGEQSVLSKEIYADGTSSDDDVFGYQERYAHLRYKPSRITGEFRPSGSGLDIWHLSQQFGSRPTLDQTFIEENPPFDRCVATPSDPHFMLDCYFKYIHVRPMPVYSQPGYLDHF